MMKLFAVLFCTLILAGCKQVWSVDCEDQRVTCSLGPANINTYEIVPVATAKAPWKVGERIVEEGRFECLDLDYYREFLGVTQSGLALVQDFYLTGEKFTNPFLMTVTDDEGNTQDSCPKDIEGNYVQWYKNGQKKGEVNFENGRKEGLSTTWYDNGQKRVEVNFVNGKEKGCKTEWFRTGQKKKR